jgi:hypothetical protein
MQDNRVSFRAHIELRDWLEQRAVHAERGETTDKRARAELELWRDVLTLELQRTGWTLDELRCLTDVLSNTRPAGRPGWTGQAYGELDVARISDTAGMNARYGAEFLAALAERLRQLGPAADIALVDAIRRLRSDPDLGADAAGHTAAGFRVAAPYSAPAAAYTGNRP